MRVVILTQYFPPEIGAPQSRLGFLARSLEARGDAVTVVTGMPNYPTGRVPTRWRRHAVGCERNEFGTVLRSWLYASTRRGTTHQILNYATFAFTAAATAPWRIPSADIVLWESPPLFLAPTAVLLARRLGARLVMNVSDLWPRSIVELGLLRAGGTAARALEGLERWAYARADLVTCQTDGIAAGIEERLPGSRPVSFPNGVDLELFTPSPGTVEARRAIGADERTVLAGYAGNFGRAQALEQIVDAAAVLEASAPEVRLVLAGDGPRRPAVEQHLQELRLGNVGLLDPIAHRDVPRLLASLDIGLVTLADRDVFSGARPSKLFELLAAGLPVVYAGRGEGAHLAEASGAASVVEPEQPQALARAIATLADLDTMQRRAVGERGRDYVRRHFDRAALTDDFVAKLEALTRPASAGGHRVSLD